MPNQYKSVRSHPANRRTSAPCFIDIYANRQGGRIMKMKQNFHEELSNLIKQGNDKCQDKVTHPLQV